MEYFYEKSRANAYCKTCKYEKLTRFDETCDYCLDHDLNKETGKPVNWEEKENK